VRQPLFTLRILHAGSVGQARQSRRASDPVGVRASPRRVDPNIWLTRPAVQPGPPAGRRLLGHDLPSLGILGLAEHPVTDLLREVRGGEDPFDHGSTRCRSFWTVSSHRLRFAKCSADVLTVSPTAFMRSVVRVEIGGFLCAISRGHTLQTPMNTGTRVQSSHGMLRNGG
jgi:hypothetical protein